MKKIKRPKHPAGPICGAHLAADSDAAVFFHTEACLDLIFDLKSRLGQERRHGAEQPGKPLRTIARAGKRARHLSKAYAAVAEAREAIEAIAVAT